MTAVMTLAAALILLAPQLNALPQEVNNSVPSWALYERGVQLLPSADDALVPRGENDPGEALRFFRRAIAQRERELAARDVEIDTEVSLFPEAEAGLARVYLIEGNLVLAERHYRRALEAAAFLAIPQTEWEIRYDLAGLYDMSERRRLAQQEWLAIVDDVDSIESPEMREQLDNYQRIFWEEGIDRLLQLYRQSGSASIEANLRLGEQFLRMGRYEASLDHDMMAVVKLVTIAMEEIRVFRPLYEFEELGAALGVAWDHPLVFDYLLANGLFEALERLAQVSYRLRGASSRSRELWGLVATHAPAGSVARRKAQQRLTNPQSDPLIVPR